MKFIIKSCCLLALILCTQSEIMGQYRIQKMRTVLIQRLDEHSKKPLSFFPPVQQDLGLFANATFRNDSIFIGNIQEVFQTFDDSLSILYHEYAHFLMSRKRPLEVGTDKEGNILQWDTGINYVYVPPPEEIIRYVKHFEEDILPSFPNYGEMDEQEKARTIREMEKSFSQSENKRFIYSPSNLAKEEIRAYRYQLRGEKKGLYRLSMVARQNILLRIRQKKSSYKMSRAYEKKHKLKQSGIKKA